MSASKQNIEYFEDNVINPIVLGKGHNLRKLIVEDCHHRMQHLGIQPTLNKVRMSGFRLINPYKTIKTILN